MKRKWEIRRVSGFGFLKDIPMSAYSGVKDEEKAEAELKKLGIKHVGKMEDFVSFQHLFEKYPNAEAVPESEIQQLKTSWQGQVLPPQTVYCVITETEEEGDAGSAAPTTAEALKKVFVPKIEDRVVSAEGDKMFADKSVAEARKNVGQGEKMDGGVWGVKRKAPPR